MPTFLHPGVYVAEVPSGVRSVEGAPTSTTIFVGETERGPVVPTRITSRTDYERLFGGYHRARDDASPRPGPSKVLTAYAVDGFYLNGGSSAYVLRAVSGQVATAGRDGVVVASSPGVWGNDVAVAFVTASGTNTDRFRIVVAYDDPGGGQRRLVESWDRLSVDPDDENYAAHVLQRSLYVRWAQGRTEAPDLDTIVASPVESPPRPPDDSDLVDGAVPLADGAGGGGSLSAAEYGLLMPEALAGVDDAALLVACCDVLLDDGAEYSDYVGQFVGFAENRPRQDLFFVGDLPPETGEDTTTAASETVRTAKDLTSSTFAGLYWPHVVVGDVAGVGRNPTITLPPAGYVAGLFSRTDLRRGVWKAPAGTEATLSATLALDHRLTDLHSDDLNPAGVNALRQVPGAGRVVWGSRTMVPSGEWRYVPVRRTAIFLRTSIYNGIQWAVFEPNDQPLWDSLRTSIGGFMETQFRNGAFAGRTSDEAYLVKVDAETTTEADQAAGVVNVLVAFAPLRPAEFVVIKLSQKTTSAA